MKKLFLLVFTFTSLLTTVSAQNAAESGKKDPPGFKLFRTEEDYSYLKDPATNPYRSTFIDPVKYIPVDSDKDIYLTLGGEYRPRVEYFNNRFWTEEDVTFYSQRLSLHVNANLSRYFRIFGELAHGLVSLEQEEFANSDKLDLQQAFFDIRVPMGNMQKLSIRGGRQEMAFGSARLLGIREGPNIRRVYDMGKVIYSHGETTVQAFYGREVRPRFETFDNNFELFNETHLNPLTWGAYSQFKIPGDPGKNELYYIGFKSDVAIYNDAQGEDTRHTIGLRRFGKLGKSFNYNTEFIFQFGETGGKDVFGWALETDWTYTFDHKMRFKPGLKIDILSGDNEIGDDKLQTFNPMFTNPGYFSLAATLAPVNLIEFHPSFSFRPLERLEVYAEWATFFRYSMSDGLYAPPRFLARSSEGTESRYIGNQFGIKASYEISRNISADFDLSYFIAGKFLEDTGNSENIFHVAPTLSFKF